MSRVIGALCLIVIMAIGIVWMIDTWTECRQDHSVLYCMWMLRS